MVFGDQIRQFIDPPRRIGQSAACDVEPGVGDQYARHFDSALLRSQHLRFNRRKRRETSVRGRHVASIEGDDHQSDLVVNRHVRHAGASYGLGIAQQAFPDVACFTGRDSRQVAARLDEVGDLDRAAEARQRAV